MTLITQEITDLPLTVNLAADAVIAVQSPEGMAMRAPVTLLQQNLRGDPGGNVGAIGVFADLGGMAVPMGADRVWTTGAVTVSDGGAADYLRDNEQTALSAIGSYLRDAAVIRGQSLATATAAVTEMERRFRRKDTGNRWFRLNGHASHLAYKLAGDSDLLTIQNMIDACVLWKQPMGQISTGYYMLNGPLFLAYGDSFHQVRLEGSGQVFNAAYGPGNLISDGSLLVTTDPLRPGIIAQGYRESVIKDLTLVGVGGSKLGDHGFGYFNPVDLAGNPVDDFTIAPWYTVTGLTHRRYAPHSGVSLEPLGGDAPVGVGVDAPYPATPSASPAYLGPLPLYNRLLSSSMEIRAEIIGFEVGVMVNSSTYLAQTDFTTSDKLSVFNNIIALAIGNTQSRKLQFRYINAANFHTLIDNISFGQEAGQIHGQITASISGGIRVLDINLSFAGPNDLTLYAELLHYLGDVRNNGVAGSGSLLFRACFLTFTDHPKRRGVAPWILGNPDYPGAGFVGDTSFELGTYVPADVMPVLARDLKFEAAIQPRNLIFGYLEAGAPAVDAGMYDYRILDNTRRRRAKMARNGMFGLATPEFRISHDHRITSALADIDFAGNSLVNVTTNAGVYNYTKRNYGIPFWQARAVPWSYSERIKEITMPRHVGTLAKATLTAWTRVGRVHTFTLPAAYTAANKWRAYAEGIAPGRAMICGDSGTVFVFLEADLDSGVCIVDALNNYHLPVGAAQDAHRVPMPMAGPGTFYCIETGFHMAAYDLIGDVTAGSTDITNLRRGDGFQRSGAGPHWLSDVGNPIAGDWLFWDDFATGQDYPFTQSAALIASFNLTTAAVGGLAADSARMSGNASFTKAGVRFPLFRRA